MSIYRPSVRSRHPSHKVLRSGLDKQLVRSVIRMGSVTEVDNTVSKGGNIIEINTIESIRNSASKLRMKNCFMLGNVATAEWFTLVDGTFMAQFGLVKDPIQVESANLPFPIVAKHVLGSRGTGNYKLDNIEALTRFLSNKDTRNYIFEKYYSFSREYRIHMSENGCFYACRKALKKDVPEDKKWQRHDDNCVWFTEKIYVKGEETSDENPNFQKPINWDEIVDNCRMALEATGLDICSFDVRVQGADSGKGTPRKHCEFIIIECNSASSFGKITAKKYLEEIPKIIQKKGEEYKLIKTTNTNS